ncbi:hypothetical protein Tco_0343211 [Tanacetum coccineum]
MSSDEVPILCDNTSAIAISTNSVLHSRTKHIDIRLRYSANYVSFPTKETVKAGLVTLGLVDEKNPNLSSTDLVNSSLLKIRYFSLIWKVMMLHVVKCLGVATSDATKSLEASEWAEELRNQTKPADAKKVTVIKFKGYCKQ